MVCCVSDVDAIGVGVCQWLESRGTVDIMVCCVSDVDAIGAGVCQWLEMGGVNVLVYVSIVVVMYRHM